MAVSVTVWLFVATNLVCALLAGWRLYRQHQQLAVLRAQVKWLFAFGCGRVVTQGGSWPC